MENQPALPRPETAWDLCDMAADLIADGNPWNYFQAAWAVEVGDVISNYYRGDERDLPQSAREACGTAFCRAGAMAACLDAPRSTKEWTSSPVRGAIYPRMERLLMDAGCTKEAVSNLFSGYVGSGGDKFRPGDAEYVTAGVKGLRDFMAAYEEKLKAYKIPEGA